MLVRQRLSYAILIAVVLCAPLARAEKLSKGNKKWLRTVRHIILPDEDKTYKNLKQKDRKEFEKIFWARRDATLDTLDENEFKSSYEKAVAEANSRYRVLGRSGSTTDCGRVFILLGEPSDITQGGDAPQPGMRRKELWTYTDTEHLKFKDGRLDLPFDQECQLPPGVRFGEQLKRLAEMKVLHPNLVYRFDSKDRLVKLADLLPKPSPVRTLLETPREDFAVEAEVTMILRQPDGAAFVAGLIRGDGSGMESEEIAGERLLDLLVAAQAVTTEGTVTDGPERKVTVELAEDDSFLVSFGLALRSGEHTLKVGVVEPKSGQGTVATEALVTPDFAGEEMSMSTLLVLEDIEELLGQPADPRDPLASFTLTGFRVLPRFGNVFKKSDSITFLCALYGSQVDEETGNPSLAVSFEFLKDGRTMARAPDQTYDTPNPSHSVGPVPLARFDPGSYVARITVHDALADKEYSQEAGFDIVEEPGAAEEPEPAAEPQG